MIIHSRGDTDIIADLSKISKNNEVFDKEEEFSIENYINE